MKRLMFIITVLFLVAGCATVPKMNNPVVASKTIEYSYDEIKYRWVCGNYVQYTDHHPFKRYITIMDLNTNTLQWETYSFYVTQSEFDKAILNSKYTGPIPDDYGMWPIQFE